MYMARWDKMNRLDEPYEEDIRNFVRNEVWEIFYDYITQTYACKPVFEYSNCVWPGWNVKFKKGGKNLCTVYPFEGYLWVLVVVGQKEKERFEKELPTMSKYLRNLYRDTQEGMGQRWLRIELEDKERMDDIKKCIRIKRGQK